MSAAASAASVVMATDALLAMSEKVPVSKWPMRIENFDGAQFKCFDVSPYSADGSIPGKYIAFAAATKGEAPSVVFGQLRPAPADSPFVAASNVRMGFPGCKPAVMDQRRAPYVLSDKLIVPFEFVDHETLGGLLGLRSMCSDATWEQRDKIDEKAATDSLTAALTAADGDATKVASIAKYNIGSWVAPVHRANTYKDVTSYETSAKASGWAHLIKEEKFVPAEKTGKPYFRSALYKPRAMVTAEPLFDPPLGDDDCVFEMVVGFRDGLPITTNRVPDAAARTGWRAVCPSDVPDRAPLEITVKQPKIHFSGAHTGSIQLTVLRVRFGAAKPKPKVVRALAPAIQMTADEIDAFFAEGDGAPALALPAVQLSLEDADAAAPASPFSAVSRAIAPSSLPPLPPPPPPAKRAKNAGEEEERAQCPSPTVSYAAC